MSHFPSFRRLASGLGMAAALLALPFAVAQATPVMDGELDAGYTKIASSPKDNLNTAGVDINNATFNDETTPIAKLLDVTDLYVDNTGSDLFIYVAMPYLDLNIVQGEFAIAFHLGGENDGIQYLGSPNDPYGAPCDYAHSPALNVLLKSGMAGFKHAEPKPVGFDGNQGWSFLLPGNGAWDWGKGNSKFLTDKTWVDDIANNLIHATGYSGGEIVYKGGKGIEIKIPLTLFASGTDYKTPKIGETISMQFYDNIRYYSAADDGKEKYPRGPVDAVPFEDGVYNDTVFLATRGYLTKWSDAYTLKAPPTLEVGGASTVAATDINHIYVNFTAPLGAGATTASNYAVVDKKTGTPVTVTAAEIDPNNDTRAILTLENMPFSTTLGVTVSNVKNTSGSTVSATKNAAEIAIYAAVAFDLRDPYGAYNQLGNDPVTGVPYVVTILGDFNSWTNTADGTGEIVMKPVSGETGHWRTVIMMKPGLIGYKYRVPTVVDTGNWDAWNCLNPYDRRVVVPPSGTVVEAKDNAAGSYAKVMKCGPAVNITFTLVDLDNKVNGKNVYVTGDYNGWSGDPLACIPVTPVAGKANTYSGTWTTSDNYGQDITHKIKFLLVDPATGGVDWNILNPNTEWNRDQHVITKGTGTPLAQTWELVLGPKALRIGRIASGLNQAPSLDGDWRELDANVDGEITLLDAVKALHP